ncbi:MAG: YwiC-like family protein [Anaerolineales bacterium]|jgi:hypothetical protein
MKNHPHKLAALPSDHGSWVFLLSPLLIGLFATDSWNRAGWHLILVALAAFMLRQPASLMVKAYAGRRSRKILPATRLWFSVYTLVGLFSLIQLIRAGFAFVLWLAVPGILVFAWHLWLVSRRAERHRIGVDILASGTLALAAPAACWVGTGSPDATGWWLWGLTWFQSAASIVYAFLRLEQRQMKQIPPLTKKLRLACRALTYAGFNLTAVIIGAIAGLFSPYLWAPYTVQFLEVVWGAFRPAVGVKPTRIGLRQLAVSTIFTILFILVW